MVDTGSSCHYQQKSEGKVTSRTLVITRSGFGAKFSLYVLEMNVYWTAWNTRYFYPIFPRAEQSRNQLHTKKLFVKHEAKGKCQSQQRATPEH